MSIQSGIFLNKHECISKMVRGSVPSKRQTHQFLLLHGYIAKVSQILKAALPNRKYYSMLSWDENTQCFGGLILVPSAKMTIFLFKMFNYNPIA